jgi:glutaredoxin-related protein
MKKIIYILFLILPINVFSQIIVAHVDTFQSFTHPVEMTTAQSMDSNLIEYTDWGVGNTYWTFNLDSKKVLGIQNDGSIIRDTITIINQTNGILNVDLDNDDGTTSNVLISKEIDNNNVVMYVRWVEFVEDKLKVCGWFSKNVEILVK